MKWEPRTAMEVDIPALERLIPLSVRELQRGFYSPAQIEAALGPVFGVDRQLIQDGTYFVVEHGGEIIGCGGWSKRHSLFGGDSHRPEPDTELDPSKEAARIRAFFVQPAWARQGIGRSILLICEHSIHDAGFSSIELVATLAGEPLYASSGYAVVERYKVEMAGHLTLPVVRMIKRIGC